MDSSAVKALIFDVDGTLYVEGPLRLAVLRALVQAYWRRPLEGARVVNRLRGYRRAHEELRRLGVQASESSQIKLAAQRLGCGYRAMAEAVERWMIREPLALVPRYRRKGLLEFLDLARARGWRLGVLSDYPARLKLEALGVAPYFDTVICAQDAGIGRLKPDPRGLLAVVDALEIKPSEAVYLGNRPDTDASVAHAAGVACVIFGARSTSLRNGPSWTGVRSFAEASRRLKLAGGNPSVT